MGCHISDNLEYSYVCSLVFDCGALIALDKE